MLTHFLAILTQFSTRFRGETWIRGGIFGTFEGRIFRAGLWVNFKFGRIYASEDGGTNILIKLTELVNLCVKSGEFMVILTLVAKDLGQLRAYTPTPAKVEHLYNVNLVRLSIEQRRPDAQWTSERQLCAGQKIETGKKQPHRPDAVVITHNRQQEPITVAVEIELTTKTRARLDNILQELAQNTKYKTIWYFSHGSTYKVVSEAIKKYPSKFAVYDLDSLKGDNLRYATA